MRSLDAIAKDSFELKHSGRSDYSITSLRLAIATVLEAIALWQGQPVRAGSAPTRTASGDSGATASVTSVISSGF